VRYWLVSGCVGWSADVLPHEKHESLLIEEKTTIPVFHEPPTMGIQGCHGSYPELAPSATALERSIRFCGSEAAGGGQRSYGRPGEIYGIASKHGIWYRDKISVVAGFFRGRNHGRANSCISIGILVVIGGWLSPWSTSLIASPLRRNAPVSARRLCEEASRAPSLVWFASQHSWMSNPLLTQRNRWLLRFVLR